MTPDTQTLDADVLSQPPAVGEQMQAFSFLVKTYELCSDSGDGAVPIWDVGSVLGIDEGEAESLARELQERNLIYYSSLAGDIALTSFGMSEIVLARSLPEHPTTHFPPLATMSEQMMLPLAEPRSSRVANPEANGAAQCSAKSIPEQIQHLSEQLNDFTHCLQGSESALHLDRSIDTLDAALSDCSHWPGQLLSELEEVHRELSL